MVGTCILQFRANQLSEDADELTRKGNTVAENSYRLQLWDDRHDHQVRRATKIVFHNSETYCPRTCNTLCFVKALMLADLGSQIAQA